MATTTTTTTAAKELASDGSGTRGYETVDERKRSEFEAQLLLLLSFRCRSCRRRCCCFCLGLSLACSQQTRGGGGGGGKERARENNNSAAEDFRDGTHRECNAMRAAEQSRAERSSVVRQIRFVWEEENPPFESGIRARFHLARCASRRFHFLGHSKCARAPRRALDLGAPGKKGPTILGMLAADERRRRRRTHRCAPRQRCKRRALASGAMLWAREWGARQTSAHTQTAARRAAAKRASS